MQTRQWHLFLVLVVGLPLKLHSSQGLFFPKTTVLMLQECFLIAENTCEKIFCASRRQIATSHLCTTSRPYHFFYATAAPVYANLMVVLTSPCTKLLAERIEDGIHVYG